jgi:hypothetical protein
MENSANIEVQMGTFKNVFLGKGPESMLVSNYATGDDSLEIKHGVDRTSVRVDREALPALIEALKEFL